ncbi:hypothetical protein OIU85_008928 [Salix viminalis]|uniref:KIB1-4 beta-propeller domain-containing protein n=1 Tax=Salix viminalis TaxID=40686 RepID=A0A9Q0SIT6_SALVM|nr:hypothetical protein OIU85_008928 [Salix viminalis]
MAISWLAYTPPLDAGISFCHDDEGPRPHVNQVASCSAGYSSLSENSSREFQRVTGPVIIDTVPDKLPWLLLPHDTQCESLKFYDLSRNKVHELNLPEVLLGGVSVEVSRGWLAIAKKGKYIRDTKVRDTCWSTFPRETDRDIEFSDIIFYNGDLCVLSQKIEHVETHIFKLAEDDGVRIKFIPVSTAARLPFIEAEHWGHNMATIKHALYEPYLVESINGELLIIVAHNVCYAYYDEDEDEESLDGDEDALEEERLGEDEDALEEERLDEDGDEERLDEEEGDFEHFFDEEDDIEEGDHFERFYFKISGFDVMEMDPNAGMILRSVQSLSDQLILLTSGGRSVSVPANDLPCGIQRNCIFFLENDNYFSEVFDAYQTREELLHRRVSRESGICYLESGELRDYFQVPIAC